ncbi:hypothetical protein [Metabacillus niabensis]|uniref:hypothetical protein n=1 Tax=Metabacillus niabensis TaxID=324854 RepID=UPI0039A233F9
MIVFTLFVSSISPTVIQAKSSQENKEYIRIGDKNYQDLSDLNFDSFEDIPKELLDPTYFSEDEIIKIPEEYLNLNNPEVLYITYVNENVGNGQIQTFAIGAAAGVYFIPGIGQVALTVTGAIVIGGATIAAGSWLYNKVSAYFSKKAAEEAAEKIPNSLKSSDMKVDLKKFKDKNGKTPADRTSGTFTNGKWVITKDTSGHLGYNGNKKAWKLGTPLVRHLLIDVVTL